VRAYCPSCKRQIAGADIDLAKGVGVCRPCGEIVALPRAEVIAAEKLVRPEDVRMEERADGDGYVATIPPNRGAAIPALFFCLFWDGFLAFWYWKAIQSGTPGMMLFPVLHLAAGVYITHAMLVGMFNVRTLRIADGRVTYRSGPIPLAGKLDVRVDEIESFTSVEQSGRTTTWAVAANLTRGAQKKIDVVTNDVMGTRWIAASFSDALARAKEREAAQRPPYR